MKLKNYVVVLFLSIIVLIASFPSVSAESTENPIIDEILIRFFEQTSTGSFRGFFPWGIQRFQQPEAFDTDPKVLEIEYHDKTEIIIGVKNETGEGYVPLTEMKDRIDAIGMLAGIDWEFVVELPEEIPEGTISATFNPPLLVAGEEGKMKTKLVLISDIPKDFVLPKEILLHVNISRYVTAHNTYIAPKDFGGGYYPSKYVMWFIMSLGPPFGPFPFGPYYSGKRVWDGSMYVDILVKINRFHLVDINVPDNVEVGPDRLSYIPVEIENYGSHLDTFNLNISTNDNGKLKVTPVSTITLGPQEKGTVYIGISTPRNFLDPGTLHPINIEVYSIYNPDNVFTNTVSVTTRGVYLSERLAYVVSFYSAIILFFIAIFMFYHRRKYGRICERPDKPWQIPQEIKHLQKLRDKDKAEYKKTYLMMEDEYKSSLLWYKYYCKAMLKKKRSSKKLFNLKIEKTKNKVKKLKKADIVKENEKPKHIIKAEERVEKILEFKELEEELPDIIEEKPAIISKSLDKDDKRKEQAILRIRQAQEKQKRKLGTSI